MLKVDCVHSPEKSMLSVFRSEAENKYAADWALHKPLFGGSLKAMNRALQKGADINWKNKDGVTALHYCCTLAKDHSSDHMLRPSRLNAYGDAVINLLALGANPNVLCTANQETALHAFVLNIPAFNYSGKAREITDGLLSNGVDVSIRNKNGKSAGDILQGLGKNPDIYWLQRSAPVQKADESVETVTPEQQPAATETEKNPRWVPLGKDEIARVSLQPAIGYKITEIFNFAAKNYKSITQNLGTRVETQVNKSFAELAQDDLVTEAKLQLDLSHTIVPISDKTAPKTNLRIVPDGQG
jgi:hypothetical protein